MTSLVPALAVLSALTRPPMRLWADLRSVAPPNMLDALTTCERAADSPVDAVLVTRMPTSSPPCDVILCTPLEPDAPSSALIAPDGTRVGIHARASDPCGQSAAMAAVGSTDWIHLDASTETDWTMIPAENVISACDGTPTQLAVTALSAEQVPGLAFALQLGVDALVVTPPVDEPGKLLWEAAAIARAQRAERDEESARADARTGLRKSSPAPTLTTGVITAVDAGGIGDRVALDFTSLLQLDEGALVGSSAKLMGLVHGETIAGELVPARPFRVNAGPVHAYILLADGTTKYLEEVAPNDEVVVMSAHGVSRALRVGRCKVEPRPLLLLSFEADGAAGQLFLQQAETVRLMVDVGGEFEPRSVTQIKLGDRIRVRQSTKGTHVGRVISARVEER